MTAAYSFDASDYPDDEPESRNLHLLEILEEVATDRIQAAADLAIDPSYPEHSRAADLSMQVDDLVDEHGRITADYRERLVRIAASAVDAVMDWDRANRPGESGEVVRAGAAKEAA
jgi:hypothetical protein